MQSVLMLEVDSRLVFHMNDSTVVEGTVELITWSSNGYPMIVVVTTDYPTRRFYLNYQNITYYQLRD